MDDRDKHSSLFWLFDFDTEKGFMKVMSCGGGTRNIITIISLSKEHWQKGRLSTIDLLLRVSFKKSEFK
jgi:hypothetical protein